MYYPQVPRISISPPPPEEPLFEPYSPFAFIPQVLVDNGSFRPVLLTPPCTTQYLKPEGNRRREARGIGLESQRFQQLLKATRERKAAVHFRKELALKNNQGIFSFATRGGIQSSKLLCLAERRAIFLSKVQAPPSPTATTTPSTPPDSPSVFHYTLPSPGLVSPFSVFETVDKDTCGGWVETVYFDKQCAHDDDTHNDNSLTEKRKSRANVPSLEQISARMMPSTTADTHDTPIIIPTSHKRPLIGVGRLRMPLRASQSQPLAPQSEPSSQPTLRMTTVVQNTANSIPSNTKLTETNLSAFNVRGQKAHDMLCTLRKRTLPFATKALFCTDEDNKRHSAPPEMTSHPRIGFSHPVLALPGSF